MHPGANDITVRFSWKGLPGGCERGRWTSQVRWSTVGKRLELGLDISLALERIVGFLVVSASIEAELCRLTPIPTGAAHLRCDLRRETDLKPIIRSRSIVFVDSILSFLMPLAHLGPETRARERWQEERSGLI